MNEAQIECFINAAETLNFTKTAKMLYITQPTVTHHVTSLENELGFPLFERINKQVFLTPAGKNFYGSVKKISSDFTTAVLTAKKYGNGYRQELRIGCGSSEFEASFIPAMIRTFKKDHSDIYVSFVMEPIREKMMLMQEEKIDILFATTDMTHDKKRFEYIPLQSYQMVCVMNRENKLSTLPQITLNDIREQNLLLLDSNYAPPEMNELQMLLEQRYHTNITHYLSNVTMSHLIILCNMGIAIMPEFKYQQNDNLIAVPFTWHKKISYGISYRKNDPREFVQDFVRIAKAGFDTH